jgi:cytochrome c553
MKSVLASYPSRYLVAASLLMFSHADYAGMIDKKGMQAWEICGMCHNANGISPMPKFPKLAGQKAGYLEQQIHAFREGRRQNDGGQMQSIVGEVSQEDVPGIAAYFSALAHDAEVAIPADELDKSQQQKLSQGYALFTKGRDGITPCADCHASKASDAPWIDGQHKQYLQKQMQDFYSGERIAGCALAQAGQDSVQVNVSKSLDQNSPARLTEAEIEALAFYLSTLKLERK